MSAMPAPQTNRSRVGSHDIVVLTIAALIVAAQGGQPCQHWLPTLPYVAGLVVLALMDVELPHGDTVDVDTAVVVASIYIFGPSLTLGMVFSGRVLAYLLQYGKARRRDVVPALAKRVVGVGAAAMALAALNGLPLGQFRTYVDVLAAGMAYTIVSLVYAQVGLAVERRDSVIRMTVANVALQGPVLAAEISVATLMVVTHGAMGAWVLLLVLFLAAMTRQSFALLLDVRQGYQATIEALVGAMEAQRIHGSGIGHQVAALARSAGAEYGWFGKTLENVGYAALLVHFGLSFVTQDNELGEIRPTPLAEVEFLRPVAPIVEVAENPRTNVPVRRRVLAAAYIVTLSVGQLNPERTERMMAGLSARLTPEERWRCEDAVNRASDKLVL